MVLFGRIKEPLDDITWVEGGGNDRMRLTVLINLICTLLHLILNTIRMAHQMQADEQTHLEKPNTIRECLMTNSSFSRYAPAVFRCQFGQLPHGRPSSAPNCHHRKKQIFIREKRSAKCDLFDALYGHYN